jgi:hypothetical protein
MARPAGRANTLAPSDARRGMSWRLPPAATPQGGVARSAGREPATLGLEGHASEVQTRPELANFKWPIGYELPAMSSTLRRSRLGQSRPEFAGAPQIPSPRDNRSTSARRKMQESSVACLAPRVRLVPQCVDQSTSSSALWIAILPAPPFHFLRNHAAGRPVFSEPENVQRLVQNENR